MTAHSLPASCAKSMVEYQALSGEHAWQRLKQQNSKIKNEIFFFFAAMTLHFPPV